MSTVVVATDTTLKSSKMKGKKSQQERLEHLQKAMKSNEELLKRSKVQNNPERRSKVEQRLIGLQARYNRIKTMQAGKVGAKKQNTSSSLQTRVHELRKRLRLQAIRMQRNGLQKNSTLLAEVQARRVIMQARLSELEKMINKLEDISCKKQEGEVKPSVEKQKEQIHLANKKQDKQVKSKVQDRINVLESRLKHLDQKIIANKGNTEKLDAWKSKRGAVRARLAMLRNEQESNEKQSKTTSHRSMNLQENIALLQGRLQKHEVILAKKLESGNTNSIERIKQGRDAVQSRLAKLCERQQQRQQQRLETKKQPHGRDLEQKLLNKMEATVRKEMEDKLFMLALDKVYVAHYPKDLAYLDDVVLETHSKNLDKDVSNYVPLYPDILALRAKIRDEAINMARLNEPVEWISPELYERLPETWSLEDEKVYFGKRGAQAGRKGAKCGHDKSNEKEFGEGKNKTENNEFEFDEDDDGMVIVDCMEDEA